jgi:hypothetical protein
MRRVWLLATNVVREQRWYTLLMFVYIAGITATMFLGGGGRENEMLLVFKQEALYGAFFSAVIAASLFQTDRKARRITAVLSKAVTRREYLAGAIVGTNLVTASYYVAVFASLFLLFPQTSMRTGLLMMAYLLMASALVSVVTIFFTTFLHPMLATGVAGIMLASPFLAEKLGWSALGRALPSVELVRHVLDFAVGKPMVLEGGILALALVECVALWFLAGWIFERRDITLTVE